MSEVQVWVSQGDQDVHAGTLDTHRRRGAESAAAVSGWQHVAASHGLTAKAIQQMQPAFSALEDVP